MKLKILLILIFVPVYCVSQSITGVIRDSLTGEKLQLANLTFMKGFTGTNSNLNGNYTLNLKGRLNDSVKVSYVGYSSKYIELTSYSENKPYKLDIDLSPQLNKLDEIVISQNQSAYSKKYVLSNDREGNINSFYLIGHEIAYLFKNKKEELGRIKSIKLFVRKNKDADFVAKFRIKIYSYDKNNEKPGDNLLTEDLIISPKNKTYQYVINLKDKKIPFAEDEVCVGIELVDENNTSKKGDKIGPGLRLSYGENEELTWNNYRDKGWYKTHNRNKTKSKNANLLIGMTVLMKK